MQLVLLKVSHLLVQQHITGVTAAQPPVVTMSAGHNFTEGQQITIASAAGMTDINTTHTVKNPTATTLELFTAQLHHFNTRSS